MSPKSLLRHKECVSPIGDFNKGGFQEVLDDTVTTKGIDRLIFCSGKIYYDLKQYRESKKRQDVAIIRIEQLYPLNQNLIKKIARRYKRTPSIVWCQEEPQNMAAFNFIRPYLESLLRTSEIVYVGRKPAASPASGALSIHQMEQNHIVKSAYSAKKSTLV